MGVVQLILFCFTLTFLNIGNAQELPFLKFWNSTLFCDGPREWEFANNATFNTFHPSPTLAYKANGLWTIQNCNSTDCGSRKVISTFEECRSLQTGYTTTLILLRYGDCNQTERTFNFFRQSGFVGPMTTVTTEGLNLTSPTDIYSAFFAGRNSWELIDENDVRIYCWNHEIPGEKPYGFTWNSSGGVWPRVKKILFGCRQNPPTPSPSTTSTTSTTSKITSTPTVRSTTTRPIQTTPGTGVAVADSSTTVFGSLLVLCFKLF